ncbi:phage portal protein [Metaclostridioides mangenotii]|uniref:phage portal protein n=1 Tax=Metaclostridioides mangenotii TaxID=1540 RepID=UPI0026EDB7C4|nr:phage portal protein [Clostridioides mangenotii]
MRKIKRSKDSIINDKFILNLIEEHKTESLRLQELYDYFNNENKILKRKYNNTSGNKPQNRLSHPYADYIVTIATGYLLGKPVIYTTEDKGMLEELMKVFKYNDEPDNNSTLAKYASIYGYSYELLYADEQANVRFKAVDPKELIVVYDNTLEENVLLTIRYYNEDIVNSDGEKEEVTMINIHTKPILDQTGNKIVKFGEVIYYIKKDDELKELKREEHKFFDVPVVVYINNDELYGDFEKVMTLIDAYDKTESDTANDFEMFTHAMLVISGEIVDSEDQENINEKYLINFVDKEGGAKYLIKDIQDAALENYKNRLDNDIHKFSCIPNLSDENFAGNSSGVGLQFKLTTLENKISVKESKFKKGLMKRIELISHFLGIKKGDEYKYIDVEPVFTRAKPQNELEISDIMMKLTGILSEETIISLFPKITDAQAEMKRKRKEDNDKFDDYNTKDDNDNGVDVAENKQKQGVAIDEEKDE